MPRSVVPPKVEVEQLGESDFWKKWLSWSEEGVAWPMAAFEFPDGVTLQLGTTKTERTFLVHVSSRDPKAFLEKLRTEWHAQS